MGGRPSFGCDGTLGDGPSPVEQPEVPVRERLGIRDDEEIGFTAGMRVAELGGLILGQQPERRLVGGSSGKVNWTRRRLR